MANNILCLSLFCILFSLSDCADYLKPIKTVDLKKWSVVSAGVLNSTSIEIPNGIYSFGEYLNLIKNVLKNSNDEESKWIAKKPWIFTTEFSGEELHNRNNIHLVFDGVDAVAEVKLNDVVLGKMENMFRQYEFDIKNFTKNDTNKLEVSFEPPIEVALEVFSKNKYEIPPKCPPDTVKGDCHINMLRKMQTSFGSIFGPSVPSMGFWKSVRIEAFRESSLREVLTRVEDLNATFWRLHIDAYIANNSVNRSYGRMSLAVDSYPKGVFFIDIVPNIYGEMVWSTYLDFNKTLVETWWPIGYGSQRLYNLTVAYYSSNIVETTPKSKMIGFRTIELKQEKTGNGTNFYFLVNKVPIFAKGSNVVPLSVFPEDNDDQETIKRLINNAVNSNMNMLRVWGGGAYLSDTFYELADEEGILIWQDFMFTSGLYLANEEFLSNVLGEVSYQLKRIYSHPCLALFSANFEVEQALAENWYEVGNKTLYVEDYKKLFVNTIKKEFDRLTKTSGNFVISSPSNGVKTENELYVSTNPNSEYYGDVHYFEQSSNPLKTSSYPIPRFASAYGVQSLPCAESILKQANSEQSSYLNTSNTFLIHRQHMYNNYTQMRKQIELLLALPPENAKNVEKTFILYSQILQALSLKLQTEHYRSHRSVIMPDGRGNTMGALYWQMNDVWSAPTLSGIDYYGRWKMAQYAIRDAFAPVIITGSISDNILEVVVVSDLTEPKFDVIATVQVYTWNSFTPLHEKTESMNLFALTSQQIFTISVDTLFESLNCTTYKCFFYLKLEKDGDSLAPENYVLPTNLKDTAIVKHTMKITAITQLPYRNIFEVKIIAKNVAAFVWLDAHNLDGTFSENGFLMVQPQKTIYFYPEKASSLKQLENSIDVTHSQELISVINSENNNLNKA